jgi:serine O-acetyltransferase
MTAQEKSCEKGPDWSREAVGLFTWAPGRQLLRTIRWYQRVNGLNVISRAVLRRLICIAHRFWSAVAGADIPLTAKFGGGLLLPHPNGIVIHPASQIGVNCTIYQQVTLGGRDDNHGAPVIGANVLIGTGAKILGSVTVGDGARIGANAVVLADVPPRATAVGVPAKIISETSREVKGLVGHYGK